MDLDALRRHWHEFGRRDAFWAVLTHPGKEGGRWDPGEFYATGRGDVAAMLDWLASLGYPPRWKRALDFGCGAGRLTHALAHHADEVVGVDIAESMLDTAREHVAAANCRFVLNTRSDLSLFEGDTFQLVVSRLVLQHMRPRYIRAYVREFVRILEPNGALVFQLPVRPHEPPAHGSALKRLAPMPAVIAYRRIRRWLRPEFPRMESCGLDPAEVERLIASAGARLVAERRAASYEDREGYEYVATK